MKNSGQEQKVSESSIALQAGGDITVTSTGMSYQDVRNIALDVYRANFLKLAGNAAEVAACRAEEITEDFLLKLQNEFPSGLEKAQDPDFQYALLTVQREYAKSGDKELGDLLVDLLVDKANKRIETYSKLS
jgi:hypothetical protein